ncbi:hypothetical protein [Streptomyces sp. C10-9-1]|uniref:hypothetical protein n=1 Tax=Streptomyces sp. C10-9-1 TaxID=1859285 RepID=UPI003D76316C
MAQNSWPSPNHNTRNVTDLEYEKLAARFSDDGIYGDPGEDPVVAAGVGLSVDVRADVYGSVRGHAWSSGSTGDTLAISANASGSTRVDWVVLQLDRSTWDVRATVREGTPGAGAPTLVQATGDTGLYEVPLALVTVPTGAAAVTVTRSEQYVGSRIRPCTSTTRNPYPRAGDGAFEQDTGRLLLWDGTMWRVVYRPTVSENVESAVSSWTTSGASVFERAGDVVTLRSGYFYRNSGLSAAGDSRLPLMIPAEHRHPIRAQFATAYLTGSRSGHVTIYPANHNVRPGQVWLVGHPGMSTGDAVYAFSATWTV